jgi:hypothetical protein
MPTRVRVAREKFQWSDSQILKVINRALPVYTPQELRVLRDLAIQGAQHILARRAGGRKQNVTRARAGIRLILIAGIYESLPLRLRKFPFGETTLARVCDELAERYGFNIDIETLKKDVKKIGTRKLRGE